MQLAGVVTRTRPQGRKWLKARVSRTCTAGIAWTHPCTRHAAWPL